MNDVGTKPLGLDISMVRPQSYPPLPCQHGNPSRIQCETTASRPLHMFEIAVIEIAANIVRDASDGGSTV